MSRRSSGSGSSEADDVDETIGDQPGAPQAHGAFEKEASNRIEQAYRVLSKCTDFEDARARGRLLEFLHFDVSEQAIRNYDPSDPAGFATLMKSILQIYPDTSYAAELFGVATSTFYRWKSGDVVPHPLVRRSVKERILEHLMASAIEGGASREAEIRRAFAAGARGPIEPLN